MTRNMRSPLPTLAVCAVVCACAPEALISAHLLPKQNAATEMFGPWEVLEADDLIEGADVANVIAHVMEDFDRMFRAANPAPITVPQKPAVRHTTIDVVDAEDFIAGVDAVAVEVQTVGNVADYIQPEAAQLGVQSRLQRAGITTGSSESLLRVQLFTVEYDSIVYFAISADLSRQGRIVADTPHRYVDAQITLWEKTTFGSVGRLKARSIYESIYGLADQFVALHGVMNAGQAGERLKAGAPRREFPSPLTQFGAKGVAVKVVVNAELADVCPQETVLALARRKLAALGLAEDPHALDELAISLSGLRRGWHWAFAASIKANRPFEMLNNQGVMALSEGTTFSFSTIGRVFVLRPDQFEGIIQGILDAFERELGG